MIIIRITFSSLPKKEYLDNLMKSRLCRFCWEHAFRVRGRSKRPRSLLPPQSSSVKYSFEHGQPARAKRWKNHPRQAELEPLTSNAAMVDCSKFVSIEHVHKNCTRLCLILSESFCGPQFPGINSPFQPFLAPTSHHLASFSRFLGLQRKAQVCLGHGLWHPGKCPTLKVSAF